MFEPLARRAHDQNPSVGDKKGRPIKLKLPVGQDPDIANAPEIIADVPDGALLLADKGYDSNALRDMASNRNPSTNTPAKSNRKDPICFSKHRYRMRQPVGRFFIKRGGSGKLNRLVKWTFRATAA